MCENVDNLITQEEIKPRFWTQLPNLLFEMSLSANAIALYAAIKRSAGSSDGQQCTRSTRTLARNTGMSVSSVVRAKRELEGLGLIRIKEVAKGRGHKAHYITIRPIWRVNNAFFDHEERPTVSPGCKWGLDTGGNLVEFEVVEDDTGQAVGYVSTIMVLKSSTMVLLVPEMERSNNQRGKTNKKNQQHGGEKNDADTGADVVADDDLSFSLFSQDLPEPAGGPSAGKTENFSDVSPGDGNNGITANLDALAEYGVVRTRDAQAVAARASMMPALIHAWARHVWAIPDVGNKPAYLVAVLRTVTEPPNEHNNDNGQHPAHRHVGHRRRAGQRSGRGEYQSYTTSERDALWARHKDRYLALVDRGLDPNRHCSDIAKALGLTREEGHILHAGYSAWVSMQESPVDLSFLERV